MMSRNDHNEVRRVHLIISGRVQGVGFRHFAVTNAQRLGLGGWVANRHDGRVEAEVEGPEDAVENMIGRFKSGPSTARVENVSVDELEPKNPEVENSRRFRVRYG